MKILRIFGFTVMTIGLACCGSSTKSNVTIVKENELDQRFDLALSRITNGDLPKFTSDFILADISLKPQFARRFTEYSGDISGRYIQIMSLVKPKNNPIDIHVLVAEALTYQKADGRFGDDRLPFNTPKIEGNQMALLWGNGRLLAGLVDYYQAYHDEKVLESAKKLGAFLIGITSNISRPEIAQQFKNSAAMGYICFTQLVEGLVGLYDATKDKTYLNTASQIYTYLPERGNQHSHGYLNTLLGVLWLYERTGEPAHLEFAQSRVDDLLKSPDYLITGGVQEYFGDHHDDPTYNRDEGCAEADLIFVTYKLWEITGKSSYLEVAEKCMMNHFFFNQFANGEFGHHKIDLKFGFRPSEIAAHAWWCCDFHGLRALFECRQHSLTEKDNTVSLNLFFAGKHTTPSSEINIVKKAGNRVTYTMSVAKFSPGKEFAIRKPSWVEDMTILLNGKEPRVTVKNGYLVIAKVKPNDVVDVSMKYRLVFQKVDRSILTRESIPGEKYRAAVFYGPYLLSVDDIFEQAFIAEPGIYNTIFVKNGFSFDEKNVLAGSLCPEAYLKCDYKHGGFYGKQSVMLRPIAETYKLPYPCATQVWFNFLPEKP